MGPGSLAWTRGNIEECIDTNHKIAQHDLFIQALAKNKTGVTPTSKMIMLLCRAMTTDRKLAQRLRLTREVKYAHKIIHDYCDKVSNLGVRRGGAYLVYPSWFYTPAPYKADSDIFGGTQAVRLAASNPPVQQFPAEVKECWGSRYDGGRLFITDLSQVEVRMAAILSGDRFLLSAYDGTFPRDLHLELAKKVVPNAEALHRAHKGDNRRDPRQHGKIVRFQTLYGGGASLTQKILLEKTGQLMPLNVVSTMVRAIRDEQTQWFEWGREWVRLHRHSKVIRLPFLGIQRHLHDLGSHDQQRRFSAERMAINFPVQAYAAATLIEVIWYILQAAPPEVRYCLNEHDKFVLDCPPEMDLVPLINEAMHWVEKNGIWGRVCEMTSNFCPLGWEMHIQ